MSVSKLAAPRRGFTIIEMLIVIVVIAILALIVIPRLINASDRARAATYYDNVNQLTKGVESFRNDCDVYPSTLSDLNADAVTGGTLNVSAATIAYTGWNAANFHGPYLMTNNGISQTDGQELPLNPYVDNRQTVNQVVTAHWSYVSNGGVSYTPIVGYSTFVPPSGY
jgi:prepilin-type N-terminal cleavage/methylation domain-containing protein